MRKLTITALPFEVVEAHANEHPPFWLHIDRSEKREIGHHRAFQQECESPLYPVVLVRPVQPGCAQILEQVVEGHGERGTWSRTGIPNPIRTRYIGYPVCTELTQ